MVQYLQNYGSVCIEQPIYSLLEELTTGQPMKNPAQDSFEPFISGEDPDCINEAIYNALEETSPPNLQFVEINFVKCNVFKLNIQIV